MSISKATSIEPAYRPNPHDVTTAMGELCPLHHLIELQAADEAEVTEDLRWDGSYGIDPDGVKVWDWVHVQLNTDVHEVRFIRKNEDHVVICVRRTKPRSKNASKGTGKNPNGRKP